MPLRKIRLVSEWNKDPDRTMQHPDTESALDLALAEIERMGGELVKSKAHARDLARKLDAVLAMLEPGSGQVGRDVDSKTVALTMAEWRLLEELHIKARAIAEGE